MTPSYDAIVLGIGGVGSSTLYQLASRGLSVLGIEQFGIAHDRGSSHGETRAIRKAYFEHPDYVPLLERAYQLWRQLEVESGRKLLHLPGLLEVGPLDGVLIPGVLRASQEHNLCVEEVSASDFLLRFPQFALPEGHAAVFEPDGGYLLVEQCISSYAKLAEARGAQLHWNERILDWRSSSSGVTVITEAGTYQAKKLIVAAGAWTKSVLPEARLRLQVFRKHLHWYAVKDESYLPARGSPVFFYETAAGCYYGFPQLPADQVPGRPSESRPCIKVAEHSGGEYAKADQLDHSVDEEEQGRVERFLREHLPLLGTERHHHAVCMYTMSPDENFIVDRSPAHKHVLFAAGLSGHGFKFASVLGEMLADLATTPIAAHPLLALERFG